MCSLNSVSPLGFNSSDVCLPTDCHFPTVPSACSGVCLQEKLRHTIFDISQTENSRGIFPFLVAFEREQGSQFSTFKICSTNYVELMISSLGDVLITMASNLQVIDGKYKFNIHEQESQNLHEKSDQSFLHMLACFEAPRTATLPPNFLEEHNKYLVIWDWIF